MPLWSYAHPPAIELAEKIAGYAPGDLNRVFFTSGGGEAVESAWKLAKNYFKLVGKPIKHKVISRDIAYHGTTQGALSITGLPGLKQQFEPLVPSTFRVPNTNIYRAPEGTAGPDGTDAVAFGRWAADQIEVAIENEGPDTVAAVFLEPVQNAGGCFPPPPGYFQRVREICDEYDVLLVSDEVICAFGRLGEMFGARAVRLPAGHHHLRQGPDLRLRAARRDDRHRTGCSSRSRRARRAFAARLHVRRAPGLDRGRPAQHARSSRTRRSSSTSETNERARSGRPSSGCSTCRSSATCAATGYFYGIELVKDKATKETFSDEECERILYGFVSKRAVRRGPLLPRRRPRRPGHPALPAAGLRPRSTSTRWSRSCAPSSTRPTR